MMKKILSFVLVSVIATAFLSGCYGTIETGNVGVRTSFGTVNMDEVTPGFYTAFISSVREFVAKEMAVNMNDLTPKAKDNLSLKDLDLTVYYKVVPGQVAELYVKYAGQHEIDKDGNWWPVFNLISALGRNAAYEEVAKYDSLIIHTKRDEVAAGILKTLQEEADRRDKGNIEITRVVIRSVATDPSIEQSIRDAVAALKRLEQIEIQNKIAVKQAEIKVTEAKGIAEANKIINSTLTREYLQHETNLVLEKLAGAGTHTVVVPANMQLAPLIQIPAPTK